MDAELIEQLNDEADLCRNEGADDIAALLAQAVTQGTADNARIAELKQDKVVTFNALSAALERMNVLEAKLATAERDALERAAVIADRSRCKIVGIVSAAIDDTAMWIARNIRAAKEQVNG